MFEEEPTQTLSQTLSKERPASASSLVAYAVIVLFALWAMVALYRASGWAMARHDLDPDLPIRAWRLGGPQIEQYRTFLETVVEPNAEPESLVAIRPLVDNPQDSIVLAAISAYLLPDYRVVHIGQYTALSIESEGAEYVVQYPGREQVRIARARMVVSTEQGGLWRFDE